MVRNDKFSIQVPKSSKYHKVKRIQEADFLQFFNQTLHYFQNLDINGGEYYSDTNDFAESYSFEAYFEKPHINLSLYINHGIGLTECSIDLSHSFSYRPGIRRKYVLLPEETFSQAFNLMLEFCHDRGAYTKFQDTLFAAQVQALICNDKPIGGLVIDANRYFDKAKAVRSSLASIETYANQHLLKEGATVTDLAQAAGIPAEALEATLKRYSAQQKSGVDEDYGRSAGEMTGALETPPYYAVRVKPAIHHTMSGLSVNTQTQVLKKDGTPIPGLFASGEVTGGLHGANRLGGNGVADIVVNGKLAGEAAARYCQ